MQRHTTCCSGALTPVNFVNFEQLTLYFQHAGEFESASDYADSNSGTKERQDLKHRCPAGYRFQTHVC